MNIQTQLEYDCFYCNACHNYVYDESVGDPTRGLPAHTRASMLPPTWHCPKCGAGREQLRASTIFDDYIDAKPRSQLIETMAGSKILK